MARRIHMSSNGMRISKPGFDAKTAAEENLIFSTTRKAMQYIGFGTFNMPGGYVTVTYDNPVPQEPLVFCGLLNCASFATVSGINRPVMIPVKITHNMSGGQYVGFEVEALQDVNGTYYYYGRTMTWVAFEKGV